MIDLHMHSRYSSDGEFAPETLIAMSRAAGMTHIAIADHNRVDAVHDGVIAAKQAGLTLIPCVELDCIFDNCELHILGYRINHTDTRFGKIWKAIEAQEKAASQRRIERVAAMGIAVDAEAVLNKAENGVATPELIAEVCLADPRNADNALLRPLRPGGSRADNPFVNFYWDYCSQGKPAYIAISFMSLEECIALIRDTGGVSVLAHPGQSLRHRPELFERIAEQGIDGVEAYSSYHSPEACLFWKDKAARHGLAVTCGSDFHGRTKPAIRIGGHGAPPAEMASFLSWLYPEQ